ncbi:MAG: nucleotidyltransferase family protein [Limnochordia bacterium]
MKCLILAAGYATRLYPLTKDTPKPLLEVAGMTILERLLDKISVIDKIDHVYVVTNSRFAQAFQDWVGQYGYHKPITVIDDGTTSNDNRLGAIGDIGFVIDQVNLEDDLMVLAGDNLFDFDLRDFEEFFQEKDADVITAYEVSDIDLARRIGIVELDSAAQILSFEEKPQEPKSSWGVPALYIYKQETLPLVKQYLQQGNNPDAPGHFIPWLIKHKPVFAFQFEGQWHDIGTIESYEEAQQVFASNTPSPLI